MLSAVIILAIAGFLISLYIFLRKSQHKQLACVIGRAQDCQKVVTSKYSEFLGVPNELSGMLFYTVVILAVGLQSIPLTSILPFPDTLKAFIAAYSGTFLMLLVIPAVLYSIYLTAVQFFSIKKLCEYCLAANIINVLLFLLVWFGERYSG